MRMKEIGGETDRRSHHGTLRIIDVRLPKEVLIQEVTMDLDQHLRALGIAHIIYSCLLLIPAAIVFGVLTTVGMFTDNIPIS